MTVKFLWSVKVRGEKFMKERIHWIDISKGIAIILVVIGHVIS